MTNLNTRKGGVERWSFERISLSSLVLLIIAISHYASAYSDGADPSVCDSMIPGHGPEPQTSPSPYKITISRNAIMGTETVDIVLTSVNGNDEFKGFIIQVRKAGGDGKALGLFSGVANDGNNAQTMDCFDQKKNAMTQTSAGPKKSVAVQWIAPNDADAEYQVFYSVVKEKQVYWAGIPHEEMIRVTRNSQVTTTTAPVIAASQGLLDKWKEYYNECGVSKGCFGIPGKCVEQYDPTSDNPITCDILVTWSKRGDVNEYALTGRPGAQPGYIALGLSKDAFMGQDSVVGCMDSQGNVEVERYLNPGKSNEKHSEPNLGVTRKDVGSVEGNVFCKFEQKNHKINDIEIDLDSNNYYLLLAKGPAASTGLRRHPSVSDREVSPQSVHVSDTIIMGASPNNWLIQLHGGLMVIAWLLCASTGMFTARYYKLTHTDCTPFGKAFWFALHIFCMAATVFLTICGSVFILIKKKSIDLTENHPKLGVVVVGLAILQVIIAFLRPHPGTPSRPYFNWFHWAVGNSAHIIGIVCILLASELSLADLKRFGDENLWGFILLGIVLFHVLMHIVMSIHTLWADKQMDANNKKRAMQPGPMKTNGLTTEAPGTGFRTFMLSLYLLGMAAGAIVLTALVFWPKSDKGDDTPTA